MKSKNTIINNIFSKIAKRKEIELNSHKIDLSLASDISSTLSKADGAINKLSDAMYYYQESAMDRGSNVRSLEIQQKELDELKKEVISQEKIWRRDYGVYVKANATAVNLDKELQSLLTKTVAQLKELGLQEGSLPSYKNLVGAIAGIREMIGLGKTQVTSGVTVAPPK